MDSYLDILKLVLPELLVTHFDIVKHETKDKVLHLYFEEKKDTPKEFTSGIIISHGFHKEVMIQDFPLRGKNVYLHIKRRRWLNKTRGEVLQRDWDLVAQETRMTVEFVAFLKVLGQY